ncbi:(2Fe-2S) ferredoxin domain-containing protein [Egbenema bharatensis]|uniref:(2Fe-2S) ferredoxin domain-containing protein n=1 Tax=Egbenema bharatensis TaxID=3463334 RepID=UPI003A850454
MSKYKQVSEFALDGCFLGFAAKDGYKLKYLRLSTNAGEYCIKIPKDLRSTLYRTLQPGTQIQVLGYCEFCLKKGTTKFKADQIRSVDGLPFGSTEQFSRVTGSEVKPIAPQKSEKSEKSAKKAAIMVCQKSDCCKRGGRALVEALRTEIDDRGLTDQVTIKPTGCMKQCKAGPNLVMPDKTRYSRIRSHEVPSLLDKHFPDPVSSSHSKESGT